LKKVISKQQQKAKDTKLKNMPQPKNVTQMKRLQKTNDVA
jgi:hypothetical protein